MRICASSINMCSSNTSSVSYGVTESVLSRDLSSKQQNFSSYSQSTSFSSTLVDKKNYNFSKDGNTIDEPKLHKDTKDTFSAIDVAGSNSFLNYNKQKLRNSLTNVSKQNNTLSSQQYFINELRKFILFMHENFSFLSGLSKTFNNNTENGIISLISDNQSLSQSGNYNLWQRKIVKEFNYEESETFCFESTGKVVTNDGTELEFAISLDMTNSFSYCNSSEYESVDVVYTDPLVINLDSNPISVSDQYWKFDINSDGYADCIPLLKPGCGFLVFDKNNDGVINDGSELFGTSSGNGFYDLSKLDSDNNSWIDESDAIYNNLKVWQKNSDGSDNLISLRDAKVGAIFLHSVSSNYEFKNEDNSTNAKVISSGFYLSDNGSANSLMQLDLATKAII